jgi:hypothetical protein
MSVKEELTWDDYLTLILRHYADLPDEHTLTLGDMSGGEPALPAYRGFMQMTLGDLRKFRQATQGS